MVASLEPVIRHRLGQGNWNRSGRRISIPIDVREHHAIGYSEFSLRGIHDADIRLVRNHETDIAGAEMRLTDRLVERLGHLRRGEPEYLASVHAQVVSARFKDLM